MLCLSLESRGGDDSREGTGKGKANHTQGQHRATSPLLTRARVLDPLFGNIQILKKKKKECMTGMPVHLRENAMFRS